ncbi:Tigger transposable element-derived protein 1-like 139, partial [Homarus americanus]
MPSCGKALKQVKREKKVLTVVGKIQLLDKLRGGQNFAAWHYEPSVLPPLLLIEDFNHHHIPLSHKFIREKIKVLYDRFHAEEVWEMWKKFSIADCISFIQQCHDDLTVLCVNSCWRALWPEVVNDFAGFPAVDEDVQHIVRPAHQLGVEGFDDLQEEGLLGYAGEELTEEELAELVEEQHHEDDEEEEGEVEEVPTLTVMNLNTHGLFFRHRSIYQAKSVNFKRGMEQLLAPYKEILKELKHQVVQPPISMFFLPSSSPSPTPSTPTRAPQPLVRARPPPDSDSDMDDPPPGAPSSDLPPHSLLPPLPKKMRRTLTPLPSSSFIMIFI